MPAITPCARSLALSMTRASLEDTDSAYGIHVDDHTSQIKESLICQAILQRCMAQTHSASGRGNSLNSLKVQQFAVSSAARIEPYSPPLVELLKVFDDAVRGTVIHRIESAGEVDGQCRPRWSNPPLLFSSSPRFVREHGSSFTTTVDCLVLLLVVVLLSSNRPTQFRRERRLTSRTDNHKGVGFEL